MFNFFFGFMFVVCYNGYICILSDCLDFLLLKIFLIYKYLLFIDSK